MATTKKVASSTTKTKGGAKSSKTTSSKKNTSAKSGARRSSSVAVEPVVRRAKSVGWMAILESIIIGVLGGLLIWNPDGMMKLIFYIVGILLIVKGVYKIVNYFAVHGRYDFYNNDLLYGIIALVFGILAVVLWEQLSGAIGLVVGAWMIYGALVRMNTAIKLHSAGVKEWFYVLLLSLAMLALGIYMIVSVGAVLAVVGWIMIASAVIGIIDDVVFMRHVDAITEA